MQLAHRDQSAQPETKDQLGQLERQVRKARQVLKVLLEQLDHSAHRVMQVQLVLKEPKVFRAILGQTVLQDQQAQWALRR